MSDHLGLAVGVAPLEAGWITFAGICLAQAMFALWSLACELDRPLTVPDRNWARLACILNGGDPGLG